jgi:hypothetical protein
MRAVNSLVGTDDALEDRLDLLLSLLTDPHLPQDATCDRLLAALRHPDAADDIALVIADVQGRHVAGMLTAHASEGQLHDP